MKQFRVFLVSPSDVVEEREVVSQVVAQELNRIFSDVELFKEEQRYHLEIIRWETHLHPDVGDDIQDVINKQTPEYELFLGIMWKRFGTPTGRAMSGTFEEFDRAYRRYKKTGWPHIMFYFRNEGIYPKDLDELEQFNNVFKFKLRLEELGVAYRNYQSPMDFERFVREHLIRYLLMSSSGRDPSEVPRGRQPRVFINYAREDTEAARRLYRDLKREGVEVWLDQEDLLPGQQWKKSIQRAIENSRYFIALISRASINKRGFVQKEMRQALEVLEQFPASETYLVPVRLEDCYPNSSRLQDLHWLDLFPNWEEGVNLLVELLRGKDATTS